MGFQRQVYDQPAVGVEGDFCSSNPRSVVLAGPGALVAGPDGVLVGRFAWADDFGIVSNSGADIPTGFVHRNQQALITIFLAEASMLVPQGLAITLHDLGDFWARTLSVTTPGQKVFASNTTGEIQTGAAGATIAGYTETKWFARSAGAVGDLIKISTTALG